MLSLCSVNHSSIRCEFAEHWFNHVQSNCLGIASKVESTLGLALMFLVSRSHRRRHCVLSFSTGGTLYDLFSIVFKHSLFLDVGAAGEAGAGAGAATVAAGVGAGAGVGVQ